MYAPSNNQRPIDTYRFEAAVRRSAWRWFRGRIAAFVAEHKAMQTVRQLSALTDRELLDVGLVRADIDRVAADHRFSRY